MNVNELVLSLFPGVGLLDRAFAAAVANRAGPRESDGHGHMSEAKAAQRES